MSDHEIWAAGYASSPTAVDETTWARWRREIQAHAHTHGLRLAGIFTDRLATPRQPANQGTGPDPDPELQKLVSLIRERAHLRARHISVLLVPAVAHLAPSRDGTHDMVRNLMEMHYGLRVQQVVTATQPARAEHDTGQLPEFPSPGWRGTPGPALVAGRSRFQQILLGTPRAAPAVEPVGVCVNPPIAGRPVMTSLCVPAGFQSPGFIPATTSSPSLRSPR